MKLTGALTILAFAFLASQANSAAVSKDEMETFDINLNFATVMEMYYSAVKRMMPCGYPPLDIPALAPYTLDNYNFNYTNGYYSSIGSISDVMVTGLNDFNFLGADFNATTNRTTYDVIFPELKFIAAGDFNAMVYIAGFPFKWAFSGPLEIKLVDYRCIGEFVLAPLKDNPNGLQVTEYKMKFYLGDAFINNFNNLWDISANNYANKSGREFLLMFVQEIQRQMDQIYAKYLIPPVNDVIKTMSMNDLIDATVEATMLMNESNCNL